MSAQWGDRDPIPDRLASILFAALMGLVVAAMILMGPEPVDPNQVSDVSDTCPDISTGVHCAHF